MAKRKRTPIAERVCPTPETLIKLRRDVIGRLETKGKLRSEHVRAAKEIRRIWEAFGRGLFPGISDVPRQKHCRSVAVDVLDRLNDIEEIIWRTRYRPWAKETSVDIVAGAVRVSRLQLVLDIVVDNYGLRQVEGWYRLRHGLALGHLRDSLNRYAVLAGWVE